MGLFQLDLWKQRSFRIETQKSFAPEKNKQEQKGVDCKGKNSAGPDDAYAAGEESSGESSGACKYSDFKDITALIRPREQGT